MDLLYNLQTVALFANSSVTAPTMISASWDGFGAFCPGPAAGAGLTCLDYDPYAPPPLNISLDSLSTPISFPYGSDLYGFYQATISNAFQVLHAAVRLDIGYALPNNLFTNTTAVISANKTILPIWSMPSGPDSTDTIQRTTFVYQELSGMDPLSGSGKSVISVPYLCHLTVLKSAGEVIVSVFVATVTMIGTGWSLFMWVATWFATRGRPESKLELGDSDWVRCR